MFEYLVLREIESRQYHTQRSLAKQLGISLGKANHIISGLVQNGCIKAERLKNNPVHVRWHYLLTPKGIDQKVLLAKKYLVSREEEFERLRKEIEILKREVYKQPVSN